ncbi:TF26 protein, partial [Nothoprocta ornata]|nr:TF26 protein [Nothoprocta pentlandii]NWY08249.1 TF26 protein [Nothoprocta ornata]
AILDMKDMFFMVSLDDKDNPQFAFTWVGVKYTFNQPPQGYKHSPTIAHNALVKLLVTVKKPPEICIYQYIDDILIGGSDKESVRETAQTIWHLLTNHGLQVIPPECRPLHPAWWTPSKCQGPAQEVQFLGSLCVSGVVAVPDDTLMEIEKGCLPQNKKELQQLQQLIGTLGYWRKHVPGFSVIAHPLFDLLRKNKLWDWTPTHAEAIRTLKDEQVINQRLGPLNPADP